MSAGSCCTRWEILCFKLPEINPVLPKCARQFPISQGLVAMHATLRTSECFRKEKQSCNTFKRTQELVSLSGKESRVQSQQGARPCHSGCAPNSSRLWTPRLLAVSNRCDNYHTALEGESQSSADRMTCLRLAKFSKQNQIWYVCSGDMASSWPKRKRKKKKCCTWLGFALCAQAGRPNFVTQLHSPSSNSSLLQLVEDSVIKCNFLHETWVHVFLVYLFLGICESCLRLTKTSSVCLQTNRLHVAVCLLAFVLFVSISRTPN